MILERYHPNEPLCDALKKKKEKSYFCKKTYCLFSMHNYKAVTDTQK